MIGLAKGRFQGKLKDALGAGGGEGGDRKVAISQPDRDDGLRLLGGELSIDVCLLVVAIVVGMVTRRLRVAEAARATGVPAVVTVLRP